MDDIAVHEKKVRQFVAGRPFRKRNLSAQETALYCAALTHDSYSNEARDLPVPRNLESYERLEFLGDSVIELVACEHIYLNTGLREGEMTDFKQSIVANRKMSQRIMEYGLDIDSILLVGHGHRDRRSKRNNVEENMRADAFEALVGATYVLYGLDEARRVVREVLFV